MLVGHELHQGLCLVLDSAIVRYARGGDGGASFAGAPQLVLLLDAKLECLVNTFKE